MAQSVRPAPVLAQRLSPMAEMRARNGRYGIQLPEPRWQGGGPGGKQRGSEEIWLSRKLD